MTNPGEATLLIGSANALHKRKLKDHLGDTLNVKAFGAVGDGMTDDTSAIQACLDTLQPRYGLGNYTIHFPAGDYVTTDMLTFGAYSVNIVGSGKRATRIRNTVSGKVVLRADGVQYSSLQDLCLVSAGGVGSICFDWSDITSTITGANFFAVMNCTFDGGETGVRMGAGAIPGRSCS